jgi:hypothetical protein
MTRRPCTFRQRDLAAALKAAKAVGVPVKVEFEDGRMTVVMENGSSETTVKTKNEWDEVFNGDDQA